MKSLNVSIAGALLALMASQAPVAAPSANTVYFMSPSYGGSGCPQGSASSSLTPDGQTLTMLFDSYVASPTRKTCNISVPTHVPNGFQVSLITADYRGAVTGKGELSREYFFAGGTGPKKKDTIGAGDYLKHDDLAAVSNIYSKCGKDVGLRINSVVQGLSNASSISVDSLDLHQGMTFHLQYRACH